MITVVLLLLAVLLLVSLVPSTLLLRLLGLLVILWIGSFGSFGPPALAPQDSAIVRPQRAEFIFAPAPRKTWEWNLPGPSRAEYLWKVRVVRDGAGHEFRTSLFTETGVEPKHGSLAQLIADCQASVCSVSTNRSEIISSCQASVDEQERVHVVLTEPSLIRRIFEHRPTTVSMMVAFPGEAAVNREVAVVYEAWEERR